MIQIEEINCGVVFPSQQIKIVAMQPHIYLTDTQPYRWPDTKKAEQIAGINKTLEIALKQRAHFTLFPEYSIPGLDAIDLIHEVVNNEEWQSGLIVMGGIDGLTKEEYIQLCQQPNTIYHSSNGPDKVQKDEWINCSITWIKHDNEQVNKYLQPKICPAWPEKDIQLASMFCGNAVYLFKTKYDKDDFPFSFVSLICFDWIGNIDGSDIKVVDGFLQSMNQKFVGNPQNLQWIFILQENDDPNHDMFIQRTSDFLTQRSTYAMVGREKSTIVFINNSTKTLGRKVITSNRAFTSCVFPSDVSFVAKGCPPTFSFAAERYRGKSINRCYDVIFREMQPCIHSFNVRVAQFLNLTQDSKCHPIENASVYKIHGDIGDPRFPNGPVPACVKWVNDKLDNIESIEKRHSDILVDEIKISHEEVKKILKNLPAKKQQYNMHYVTAFHTSNGSDWQNADNWDSQESDALQHLLHTTTIINIAIQEIDFETSELHARIIINGNIYEVVVILGHSHSDCKIHFDESCAVKINHPILIISRDADNRSYNQKFSQKITKADQITISSDIKFTDQSNGIIQKGYSDLLDVFTESQDVQTLEEGITKYVA